MCLVVKIPRSLTDGVGVAGDFDMDEVRAFELARSLSDTNHVIRGLRGF